MAPQSSQPDRPARESEEWFRGLVEQVHDWVWELDDRLTLTYASPRVTELLGYQPAEVLGKTFFDLMPPDEIERVRPLIEPVLAAHGPVELLEKEFVRKDGSRVAVESSGLPVFDETGEFRGYRGATRDITHRREAQQAARISEERFRATVEGAPLTIIYLDNNDIVQVWNRAAERMFLRPSQEVVGGGIPYTSPKQKAFYENLFARARAGELVQGVEWTSYRKDGTPIHLSVSVSAVRDEHGRVVGLIGMAEDMTERWQAREELAESEARFRALFESAPLAAVYFDLEGRVRMWNQAAERMTGWRREEVIGQPLPYNTPDEEAIFTQLLDRVRQGEDIRGEEVPSYRRDGTPVTLRVFTSLVHNPQGRPVGVMGMAEDATARKAAQEALERERAFLSSAVDIIPFPLGFISREGELLRANRAAYQFFPDLAMADWQQAVLLRPDTRTELPRREWPITRAFGGEVLPPVELILRLPDGRDLPILLSVSPIWAGGRVVAVVWAVQDISALKQADREKDEFLALMSHELLSPLTSIMGWVEVARRAPEQVEQALSVIGRNAERQKRIVGDLLDLSRIIYGKLDIEYQPVDLWSLAQECAEDLAPALREKALQLQVASPPEPLVVNGDPRRLRQAIGNLLSNAAKFTDAGGTITVSGRREGAIAELSVHDTGRGISPDALPALFAPFRQVKRRREEGGLGLGLALVRGIVEAHHGMVSAASPGEGRGSTFTIRLPLAPGEPTAIVATDEKAMVGVS